MILGVSEKETTHPVRKTRCIQYWFGSTGDGGVRVVDVRGRSDFSSFNLRPERPHFSNFGPPTGEGARRTDVLLLAELTPSDCKRPSLAGLVPICSRSTLVDLTPKYPTLVASNPPCLAPL
jgi:hypothetical protein